MRKKHSKSAASSNTPRHKRMKRASRLQAAVHWMPTYQGKSLLHGYSRHFGVDQLCAIKELQILGVEYSPQYIAQIQAIQAHKQQQRALRAARQKEKEERHDISQYKDLLGFNEYFALITLFTEGGASQG